MDQLLNSNSNNNNNNNNNNQQYQNDQNIHHQTLNYSNNNIDKYFINNYTNNINNEDNINKINDNNSDNGKDNSNNKISFSVGESDNNFSFFFSPLELAKSKVSMVELEPQGCELEDDCAAQFSDEWLNSDDGEIEDILDYGELEDDEYYTNKFKDSIENTSISGKNQEKEEDQSNSTSIECYFYEFFKSIEDKSNHDINYISCNTTKAINSTYAKTNTYTQIDNSSNNKISEESTNNNFDETPDCWESLINCVDDASSNIVFSKQNHDNLNDNHQELLQLEEKEDNSGTAKNKTTFNLSSLNYNNIVDLLDTKEISLSTPISPLILNNNSTNIHPNNNGNNINFKQSPIITLSPLNLNISQPSPNNKISPIPSPSIVEKSALSASMNELSKLTFQYSFNLTEKETDNSNKISENTGYEFQDFKKSFNSESMSPLPAPKHLSSSCPSIPSTSPTSFKPQQLSPQKQNQQQQNQQQQNQQQQNQQQQNQQQNQQNQQQQNTRQQNQNTAKQHTYVLGEPVVPTSTSKVQLLNDGIVNVDGNYFFNEQLYQFQLRKKSPQQRNYNNINLSTNNTNNQSPFQIYLPSNDTSFFSPLGVNPITDFFWHSLSTKKNISPPTESILHDNPKLKQQQFYQNANTCNSSNNNSNSNNIKSSLNDVNNSNNLSNSFNNVNNIININKNVNNNIKNGNCNNVSGNINSNNKTINNMVINKNRSPQNRLLNNSSNNVFNNSSSSNNNNTNINNVNFNQINQNINYNNLNYINGINQQTINSFNNIPTYYNQKLIPTQTRKEIQLKNSNYIFVPQSTLPKPQNFSIYN